MARLCGDGLVPAELVLGDGQDGAQALRGPAVAERPHGQYGEEGLPLAGIEQQHREDASDAKYNGGAGQ